ncbi:MAG: dihydropteroate synthase [Ghiorsea sp.]
MPSRWLRKAGQPARVMGVLNCTPDSFSDGSPTQNIQTQLEKVNAMLAQGADIIDVGGESTRPDASPVSLDEELNRVIPVIRALPNHVVVSIDTMKAEVMRQAIKAGATLVNDVSALTFEEDCVEVVAESGVDVCLMHMKGTPETMQKTPEYSDVVEEVIYFFEQRIDVCLAAGIKKEAIILDPGIGFGKRLQDNLQLISNLQYIKDKLALPILLGTSRKSFLGQMTGAPVVDRELETALSSAIGIFCGADMIRVHDCAFQQKTSLVASLLADQKREMLC